MRKREAAEGKAAGQGQPVGGGGVWIHTRAPDFELVVFACTSGESVERSPQERRTPSAEGPGAQRKAQLPERARGIRVSMRPPARPAPRKPRPQVLIPPSLRLDARGRVAGARAFAARASRSPALRCVQLEAEPGFRRRALP